ncbi:MAG: Holliday junction branch migration protein RuvA [Bdellovibrionales bacterium]|nr:Holliday junction branch migration protein RuvA [Bdellovibrionales bacterium]
MIAYIEGKLFSTSESSIIVLVNGVGYELLCSQSTIDDLLGKEQVKLFVFTNVKEDAIQLFGFSTMTEKSLFLSLIKVNGVGPKMATQILSGATIQKICEWVESNDVKALTQLPKVGKKTAEQIILTLKGKLVLSEEWKPKSATKTEIQSALVNLGFKLAEIDKVIETLDDSISVEDGVRTSLQHLTNI